LERIIEITALQFGGKAVEPFEVDSENVVGIPELIRAVALADELNFVGDVFRRAAPVAAAVNGVAAPRAGGGTTASGNQRDGPDAVMRLPGGKVALEIDGFAIGEWLGIEIVDLRARAAEDDRAVIAAEVNAEDHLEMSKSVPSDVRDQLFERALALAGDDHIGAAGEIFVGVIGRFRTPEHDVGADLIAFRDEAERIAARDQIDVDADELGRFLLNRRHCRFDLEEGGVEHFDGESTALQMR